MTMISTSIHFYNKSRLTDDHEYNDIILNRMKSKKKYSFFKKKRHQIFALSTEMNGAFVIHIANERVLIFQNIFFSLHTEREYECMYVIKLEWQLAARDLVKVPIVKYIFIHTYSYLHYLNVQICNKHFRDPFHVIRIALIFFYCFFFFFV